MGDELESPKSYKEIFDLLFPYYLSMGMSYDLYWDDRPELVKAYKKAHEMKNNQRNQELWLQGLYVAHAINSTIGNMFTKDSKIEYPKEPIALTKEEHKKREEEKRKAKFEAMKERIRQQAEQINNKYK